MDKYFSLPDTEELVRLYADDVLRVCTYYLGKRCQAEDAFQDVFIKVIRKRDTFDGQCPPKYWLLTIARNVCRDYLKSAWATRISSYDQMTEDTGEKADDNPVSSRITPSVDGRHEEDLYFDSLPPEGELWDAIMALPQTSRDVILYRYYFDMDNEAIARVCGITESTVRSRLCRVRKKLERFEKDADRKGNGGAYERAI